MNQFYLFRLLQVNLKTLLWFQLSIERLSFAPKTQHVQSDKDLTVESVANVAECQTNVPVWGIFDANMNLIFETFVVFAFFRSFCFVEF